MPRVLYKNRPKHMKIHSTQCHWRNMRFLVLASALIFFTNVQAEGPHGLQILSKVFRQFIKSQPEDLKLGDGVHLISTGSENDARSNRDDGTVLGVLENYLENHELRIRLPELMPGKGFGRAFKTAMDEVDGKDQSEFSVI
ncbi:hypothetical protein NQ314_008546 [Rhamnusium bicolor]|uniref:Uncharacterized protein n=1 Tax=Rhamnusium bicolor TaxID=1586634 RepID=A0AAV8YBE3_9CUCU|nr:hypothetical protein NQ314_008546 [Rhamnusium bicolor]